MAGTPQNYPFGALGNSTGGAGTGGPTATANNGDADPCWPPVGFPITDDDPVETPPDATIYKLTDCATGEKRYTTAALTSGIAAEVGRVIQVSQHPNDCWQAVTVVNIVDGETEALTISSSNNECGTCLDPSPCALPAGSPPAGIGETYQSSAVKVGAGLTWEDYNDSDGSVKSEESIRWLWEVTLSAWKAVHDNAGPFGRTWSQATDDRWFIVDHFVIGHFPYLKLYTKAQVQDGIDSQGWELAPGHTMSEIEDGACVWGLSTNTWTENAALGRKGFFYIKTTGATPAGVYTWFLSGPELKPTGSQPYYEAPQTSITLAEV
jgi:hypothetical protein